MRKFTQKAKKVLASIMAASMMLSSMATGVAASGTEVAVPQEPESTLEMTVSDENTTPEEPVIEEEQVNNENTEVTESQLILAEIDALRVEAEDIEAEQCGEVYDVLMVIYEDAYNKFEADEITKEEFDEIDAAASDLVSYLTEEYGFGRAKENDPAMLASMNVNQSSQNKGNFDHIEIEINASATVVINGETITKNVNITKDDDFIVTAEWKGEPFTQFTQGKVTAGDGSENGPTIDISGTYRTGTKNDPVYYTITMTRTETFTTRGSVEYEIPLTYSVTTHYWDTDNFCPGISFQKWYWQQGNYVGAGSGIDVPFASNARYDNDGDLQITKELDAALTADATFHFTVYNSDNSVYKNVTITIPAGDTYGVYTLTKVPVGSYVVKETSAPETVGAKVHIDTDYSPANAGKDGATAVVKLKDVADVVVNNTYGTATTDITVHKNWVHNDNPAAEQPASVTLILKADGAEVQRVTVDASDAWTHTFEDMPKYDADGNQLTYTVDEVAVPNYDKAINGVYITNTYNPEKIAVNVNKVWADDGEASRPASIAVQLMANGADLSTATLNAVNSWSHSFSGLNKYDKDGKEISYTIKEIDTPSGYVSDVSGYTITNTQLTSISVEKVWEDDNNRDNIRPSSIEIHLHAGGTHKEEVVLNEANNWKHTFTNLPKYDGSTKIVYSVTEVAVPSGYSEVVTGSAETGFIVTNTHVPETTAVQVMKVWNDNNNQDGIRPASITVELLANGSSLGKVATLNNSNGWQTSWYDLPKYNNGAEIAYSVAEVSVPGGYTSSAVVAGGVTTITNTHKPATVEVEAVKNWDDNDNQDGIRPASITINLLADGVKVDSQTVNADDSWSAKFTNLPKYKAGKEIVYTVTEDEVAGYTTAVSGYNITNSHDPELIDLRVNKIWDDNNNQDGLRKDVTIQLLADGSVIDEHVMKGLHASADGNTWWWEFEGLPKYKAGKEIVYTVNEITAIDGYTTTYSNEDHVVSEGAALNITNTHTPETFEIKVIKEWDDNNDINGKRPASVSVRLEQAGHAYGADVTLNEGNSWTYTWTDLPVYKNGTKIAYNVIELLNAEIRSIYRSETTKTNSGADATVTIKNIYDPTHISVEVFKEWNDNYNKEGFRPSELTVELWREATGVAPQKVDTVVLTAADSWDHAWPSVEQYVTIDGVVKYELPYTYSVKEVLNFENADKYTAANGGVATEVSANVFKLSNSRTEATTSVKVEKHWADNDNQDGVRPGSIIVNLKVWDGTAWIEYKDAELTAAGGWTYTFTNLPKYRNGKEVQYAVNENKIDGYDPTYNDDGSHEADVVDGKVIIENVHNVSKINVSGQKTWNDNNNQDGIRPASITVNLLADGVKVDSQTVNAENGWKYSFTNLDQYKAGAEIVYTVSEEAVSGYTMTVNGYNITNTHEVDTHNEISIVKVWEDDNDRDGIRPTEINVELLADGDVVDTVTLNKANDWKHVWNNLPVNKNGSPIAYSAVEVGVYDGYVTSPCVAVPTLDGVALQLVNTHNIKTTQVIVNKIWDDAHNVDGVRPASITVNLLANGDVVKTAVLDATNNWTHSFTGMPMYKDGALIEFTVEEVTVPSGYSVSYNQEKHIITNSYTPATTDVSGEKIWDDQDNAFSTRPSSVTINLLADGVLVDSAVVTAEDGWKYSFENLPVNKLVNHLSTPIVYTVEEVPVKGYDSKVSGYDITNSLITVDVSGQKTWIDNNDQDGIRPDSISVKLLQNGSVIDEITVKEADGWKYNFENLPKYNADGSEAVYTVDEAPVAGYTVSVSGTDLTNTHTPETITLRGLKVWEDNHNQDGKRPAYITLILKANGVEVSQMHLTHLGRAEVDEWTYMFENLPKYENGTEIVYTVEEAPVEGYTTVIDGLTITNTYVPEATSITAKKIWNHGLNDAANYPESITLILMADAGENKQVGEAVVVTAAEGWSYTWDNLPKYENGEEIIYRAYETMIDDESVAESDYAPSYKRVGQTIEITNTYDVEHTNITVSKIWLDEDNTEGFRPGEISVQLYTDGEAYGAPVTLNAGGNWMYTYENVPKTKDDKAIVYTVKEVGESNGIFGNSSAESYDDYTVVYGEAMGRLTITNSHIHDETSVSGRKIWNDGNDRDGLRPEHIKVTLFADGVETAHLHVGEEDGWSYQFNNLPKYKAGKAIVYTVDEDPVPGYTKEINGYNITNTHEVTTIDITGLKVWNDQKDRDGYRPSMIVLNLMADGELAASTIARSVNGWSFSFNDVPKYKDGVEIVYTVVESVVPKGYVSVSGNAANSYHVTNIHELDLTEITVEKAWNDNNDEAGIRPDSINVNLLADGEVVQTVAVKAAEGWTYTFKNLPVHKEGGIGTDIVYTVEEADVSEHYISKVEGFKITNTLIETEIRIKKNWINDNASVRPDSIEVEVLRNNVVEQTLTLTAKENWQTVFGWNGSVEGLTIREINVPENYTADESALLLDGEGCYFTIDNLYDPPEVPEEPEEGPQIVVKKVWVGGDEDSRPGSIKVQLYRNNNKYRAPQTLSEGNNWRAKWDDVNENDRTKWYVEEVEVPAGYVSKVTKVREHYYIITNTWIGEKPNPTTGAPMVINADALADAAAAGVMLGAAAWVIGKTKKED